MLSKCSSHIQSGQTLGSLISYEVPIGIEVDSTGNTYYTLKNTALGHIKVLGIMDAVEFFPDLSCMIW